jgi:hypothetical protein
MSNATNRSSNLPAFQQSKVAKTRYCLLCPHRPACAALSARTDVTPIGYIPLGTIIECPDGFVEQVLPSETPGEQFTSAAKFHRDPIAQLTD